jgi:hypothetical protein
MWASEAVVMFDLQARCEDPGAELDAVAEAELLSGGLPFASRLELDPWRRFPLLR